MSLEGLWIEYVKRKGTASVRFTPEGSDTARFSVTLKGKRRTWEACAVPLETENMFVFYVLTGMRADIKRRAEAALFLSEINYSLKLASFQMEPLTGEITIRACVYMFGMTEERLELIDNALNICGMAADGAEDALKRVCGL